MQSGGTCARGRSQTCTQAQHAQQLHHPTQAGQIYTECSTDAARIACKGRLLAGSIEGRPDTWDLFICLLCSSESRSGPPSSGHPAPNAHQLQSQVQSPHSLLNVMHDAQVVRLAICCPVLRHVHNRWPTMHIKVREPAARQRNPKTKCMKKRGRAPLQMLKARNPGRSRRDSKILTKAKLL